MKTFEEQLTELRDTQNRVRALLSTLTTRSAYIVAAVNLVLAAEAYGQSPSEVLQFLGHLLAVDKPEPKKELN